MVAQPIPAHTDADVVSPLDPRLARRADRLAAQRVLSRLSSIPAVRGCGVRWVQGVNAVGVRVTDSPHGRRAGLAGLRTCGSVWACPVCSAKILAHRQDEVQRAATAWRERPEGGRIAFFTNTVRHDRSMTIDQVWDAVTAGQHAITTGRTHQGEKEAYGVHTGPIVTTCDVKACGRRYVCDVKSCGTDTPRGRAHLLKCKDGMLTPAAVRHQRSCMIGRPESAVLPWLRVVEVTVGEAGWHVHQHMAVFLPAGTTDAQRDALYLAWWRRWARGAADAGVDGSLMVNRAQWVTDDLRAFSDYVTKNVYTGPQRLALEVARADLKTARFGNRGAFELLAHVVANRDPDDVALWHAFEQGSRGRRQMTWSYGARDILAALGAFDVEEAQDEDIAAVETGTVADTRAWLPFDSWRAVLSAPGRVAALLGAFETSDAAGFAWLVEHDIGWESADGTHTAGGL